jgi:hypothetical protein
MDQLRDESKIWIYQAERALSIEEISKIGPLFQSFCSNWTAHNNQLKASFEFIQKRFIVLAVDESLNTASGCSIDKSVAFLKSISEMLGISLFERMQMAYIGNEGLNTIHYNEIQNAFEEGLINEETKFYDSNIQTLGEYRNGFSCPLKNHWLFSKISH